MATATEIFNTMKDLTKALTTYEKAYATAIKAQADVLNQAYTGVYVPQISSALNGVLNLHANILSQFASIYQTLMYDLLATSTLNLGGSAENFTDAIQKIRKWMNDNTTALLKQTMTLTISAITGTGNGLRQHIYVDQWSNEQQAIMPGVVTLRCIVDKTMGCKTGNEIFELIPQAEGTDPISKYAKSNYGVGKTITCKDPVVTNTVKNGFWGSSVMDTGTGVVTTLTEWSFTTAKGAVTDLIASTDEWRETAPQSILFANTGGGALGADKEIEIYQKITATLSKYKQYTGYIVYRNETSGAGVDLTFTVGNKNTTVTLPDVSGVPGSITLLEWKKDANSWLENFRGAGDEINITVNVKLKTNMNPASGLRIYGIFFMECGSLGRMPFLLTAGSTDWVVGDYFTFTCAYTPGTGLIVESLRDQLGAVLPWMLPSAASGAPGITVIADPT